MNKLKSFKQFNKTIFKYFIFTSVVFIIAQFISFIFYKKYPNYCFTELNYLRNTMPLNFSLLLTIIYIFIHNVIVCIFSVLLGLIPFLFITVLFIFKNASMIGLCIVLSSITYNKVFLTLICGILPHEIIEIPMLLYAFSIGLFLCTNITLWKINHKDFYIGEYTNNIKKSFLYVIILLLFIASLIDKLLHLY